MNGMETARRLIAEEQEKKAGFLDLGNLQLTEVPAEVFALTHLRVLNLGSGYRNEHGEYRQSANGGDATRNTLNRLPDRLCALGNLTALYLASTQVSDLSPLQGLSALQSLACSYTQVSDLSPLQGLSVLQSLDCLGTQVSDLSPLQGLSALQSLDCWGTQVSDLSSLQGLNALQSLSCSGTQVSDLSPLQGLSALQSLDCSGTQVSDLSPLQGLSALQSLTCSGTQVSDLTPLIGLVSLRKLTANGCRLSDMPRILVLHDTLREITLHQATIPGIPAEILSPNAYSSCLEDLRHHLTDLEAGTEDVREAKLMVLGNGRVGKTQICRRLRGLPYDETIPSTHGIAVTAEPWAGSTDAEALNIWDFGGQDIYHGAHTLFMETSAVFMIVWHPDFETAGDQSVDDIVFRNYPLPYWLDYVRTLGRKDSPVVVVQSRCDRPEQESRRLPADDASIQFPSLKPCWYSAKTRRGGGALEEALRGMPSSFCASETASPPLAPDACACCGNWKPGGMRTRATPRQSASTGHSPRRNFAPCASRWAG
jgi:internalin A